MHVGVAQDVMADWTASRRKDYCFTCSQGQKLLTVTAWDLTTGIAQRTYSCDTGSLSRTRIGSGGPTSICLLGRSHLLCAPYNLPFIYVWELLKEQVMLKIACPGLIRALSCSPNGVYCAGAISEKIFIWQICTGNLMAVVSQHYQPVNVLKFTDDGVHLVSGGDDSRVIVWQLNRVLSEAFTSSGETFLKNLTFSSTSSLTRHIWSDHSLPVTDLHCGQGGLQGRVATVSLDQTCKVYELASGKLLYSILFDCCLTSVTLDLAEQWLFVGADNGKIFRVDLLTKPIGPKISEGENKQLYSGHSKAISGLAVATWTCTFVSTSTLEDTARVWDIASCQTIKEIKLKGTSNKMLLTGKLPQNFSSPEESRHKIHNPKSLIKPFKKQLCYSRNSSENGKNCQSTGPVPMQLQGVNPLCKLSEVPIDFSADLCDLESMHYPLSVGTASVMEKDLALQTMRQELSELKDVHKRIYSFMIDNIFTDS